MSARWRWVVAAAVLGLAAVAGSAYVVSSGARGDRAPRARAAVPAPTRAPVLAALDAGAPVPTDVAGALAAPMRDPAFGGHLVGVVVDALTGAVLLDRSASTPMTPASTVKVLTAAAAIEALGPQATLTTRVARSGTTLYLVGGGDVTLRARAKRTYPPAADIGLLARRTAAALGGSAPARLCIDTSAWVGPPTAPGWSTGYVAGGDIAPLSPLEVDEGEQVPDQRTRVGDPAAQAAAVFTADLRRSGLVVAGPLCRAAAPATATPVASVSSAPVAALVQRMLTVSDNDLAESLGRAVARRAGGVADFAGAAAAVTQRISALGVDVSGLRLADTSGLSRRDRVSPRTLAGLLRLVIAPAHPELRPVADGLPVAGLTGTLAKRYRKGPVLAAAGLVRAKTGTLIGVNTVAGTLVDADGRLLVFAFMTDRATSPDTTEAALDRLVSRLQRL